MNKNIRIIRNASDSFAVQERCERRWHTVECVSTLAEAESLAALVATRF